MMAIDIERIGIGWFASLITNILYIARLGVRMNVAEKTAVNIEKLGFQLLFCEGKMRLTWKVSINEFLQYHSNVPLKYAV